jgi:hypothetical protein
MKKILALVAVATLMAFAAPAFAANPFMDVPMNHWAYDAIGQLASQGVVSGYPDGTFKGNQPMTRYEMASIVARALAVVDMDKASKQDVEMLKKLVVEFKDELDALGVQVDELDGRVAVLEENIGGWKISGQFRMDAKWEDKSDNYGDEYTLNGDTEFDLNRYRLYLRKQISDDTFFQARIGTGAAAFERYWVQTQLGYDITMKVGHFTFDWEGDSGLYNDEDAWFTDRHNDGFLFTKDFGMADVSALVMHNDGGISLDNNMVDFSLAEYSLYGLRANFAVNDQFRFALNGLMYDFADMDDLNVDTNVIWADFTFDFTPGIAFKGAYYYEDVDALDDSTNAYKAILDVDQDTIGFTSVWLEYAHWDEGFIVRNVNVTDDYVAPYAYDAYGASVLANWQGQETDILFARLDQQWNDKWSTYERYLSAGFDYSDDAVNYTFGVGYQLNPAVSFELAYDYVDWGEGDDNIKTDDDSIIRFRTYVSF